MSNSLDAAGDVIDIMKKTNNVNGKRLKAEGKHF